ncbi:Crp/Fnr family transcriptional regulator [Neobittarella massiliensis]|uniref:Crp/Fnr family transcriptional regulator n=1 Tax=Neobittarella massiliensis (ex Bilen et al. 2018) TaxID=2041842 RepID=A0A8J6LTB8_9FIRM|nr:Crp/Fnr family transcriptional regulator [Neobittarella massiliensis]MBC3515089.1 Crp/Fnr family transcriptional regulator [Neobittarella massiliensis]
MALTLTAEDLAALQKSELFCGLQGPALQRALAFFDALPGQYPKGALLHRCGSTLARFGLVLTGSVQVFMDDIDGNQIIMAGVGPGSTFGESMCFLAVEEQPISVVAASDTRVLWMQTAAIHRACGGDPQDHLLVERFIALLAGKALSMNDRVQVLSKNTLRGKLVVFFTQCAHRAGSNRFTVPFGRQDMAAYLGTDRSALSRELSKMQREGVLRFHKNQFELLTSMGPTL